jgi:hypothetical protein
MFGSESLLAAASSPATRYTEVRYRGRSFQHHDAIPSGATSVSKTVHVPPVSQQFGAIRSLARLTGSESPRQDLLAQNMASRNILRKIASLRRRHKHPEATYGMQVTGPRYQAT